jgi:hypothetical protein
MYCWAGQARSVLLCSDITQTYDMYDKCDLTGFGDEKRTNAASVVKCVVGGW